MEEVKKKKRKRQTINGVSASEDVPKDVLGRRNLPQFKGTNRQFKKPKDLERLLYSYLEYCIETQRVPLKLGFYNYMGICRDTFSDYKLHRPEFKETIDFINQVFEEEMLQNSFKFKNPAMFIFVLKNHYGYRDKNETEISTDINITLEGDNESIN